MTTASRRGRYALVPAAGLILAVAAEACSAALTGVSGWFIASSAVAGASVYSTFCYLALSGAVRAFALGRIVTGYASRVVLHSAALRRVSTARLAFYDRAAAGPSTQGPWSGQSLDRVLADADTAGMALIQATTPAATAAALAAGGCAAIAITGYALPALIVVIAAAICGCLAIAAARHVGEVAQARAVLRAELVTAVDAWPEMACLGAAAQLADRTLRRLTVFEERQYRGATAQARTAGAVSAVAASTVLLIVVLAAAEGATVSTLVFLALLATGVLASAQRLVPAAEARALARQAAGRLIPARGERSSQPFHAAFDGRDLTVAGYQLPGTPARPRRQIGFTVTAGQTLVVTGASGTGKTTLLNAVAQALRRPEHHPGMVTSVLADDYLFDGTVATNIRLASPGSSDRDIEDLLTSMLLDHAQISPATPTGVGGRALSGGEQRRLHIARVLATQPGVLFIDEPATGLDTLTGTHVLAAVRSQLPKTVLVLAMHRLPADTDILGPAWTVISLD